MSNLLDCKIIEFPKYSDPRGNLSVVEGNINIPFEIERVFYLYDLPTAESRGAHAHKTLQEVIIPLSGSFDVSIDDGVENKLVRLNRPWLGLYVPPMIWASELNFDPGTTYLVLASTKYDESDYIRNYEEFLNLK